MWGLTIESDRGRAVLGRRSAERAVTALSNITGQEPNNKRLSLTGRA